MQPSELDIALLYYDLAMYQIESVRRGKVRLVIVHERMAQRLPGRCIPGEQILSAWLVHGGRSYRLPLSTSHLILLDLLARHSLPMNAQQIEERLNNELFYFQLARARSTRTAVRKQVSRIRAILAGFFAYYRIDLDPANILRSEPTSSNEVQYSLNADVVIEH
jgi:hypothetical protein